MAASLGWWKGETSCDETGSERTSSLLARPGVVWSGKATNVSWAPRRDGGSAALFESTSPATGGVGASRTRTGGGRTGGGRTIPFVSWSSDISAVCSNGEGVDALSSSLSLSLRSARVALPDLRPKCELVSEVLHTTAGVVKGAVCPETALSLCTAGSNSKLSLTSCTASGIPARPRPPSSRSLEMLDRSRARRPVSVDSSEDATLLLLDPVAELPSAGFWRRKRLKSPLDATASELGSPMWMGKRNLPHDERCST